MEQNNLQKRAWTRSEISDMGLNLSTFEIPREPIPELSATLVTRAWPKKTSFRKSIICYFVTDDGYKFFLLAFQDLNSGIYKPRETNIDFTTVELGTRFALSYKISKTSWPNWITAELI